MMFHRLKRFLLLSFFGFLLSATILPLLSYSAITEQDFFSIKKVVFDEFKGDFEKLNLTFNILAQRPPLQRGISSHILSHQFTIVVGMDAIANPAMSVDILALGMCHEIGHFLGGAPIGESFGRGALLRSVEGQADYFASSKCLKRIFKDRSENRAVFRSYPLELRNKIKGLCYSYQCARIVGTAWCYGRLLEGERGCLEEMSPRAEYPMRTNQLSFSTPDLRIVGKTSTRLPDLQCRLDTFVAGAICPINEYESFDFYDPTVGACMADALNPLEAMGARPSCWFASEQ
jgi:hypothetical protein